MLCIAVRPRIDRTNLKNTTVMVGRTIFLDIDVIGEPCPEVKWFKDGKEVFTKDNLDIENVPYNTKLKIGRGKRAQSGKYKITATNEHGEDFEWVELIFLGPPSSPLGESDHEKKSKEINRGLPSYNH